MKVLVSFLVVLMISCSSMISIEVTDRVRVITPNGMMEENAVKVVRQFLAQESGWGIEGIVKIYEVSQKERDACNSSPIALEYHQEFCNASYRILYSRDSLCNGGSSIIEQCVEGECNYKVGKYIEVCE